MVTEFMDEGSLFDHIHKHKTNLDDERAILIVEDIALGMAYLHGRKVLHCDLKSSNVLIDSNWNVKLCDFGLSKITSQLNKKNKKKGGNLNSLGTPHWMAPEVLQNKEYCEYSDVYSFGVIIWEIIEKKIPYEGLSLQQIIGTVGYDSEHSLHYTKNANPFLV